jgi:hypothetical protein
MPGVDDLSDQLLALGLLAARQGVSGAGLLLGAGVLVVLLGSRLFRPAAALAGGAGGLLAAVVVRARFYPALPVEASLFTGVLGLVGALVGLASPRGGAGVASASLGLLAGLAAMTFVPIRSAPWPLAGGLVAGAVAAGLAYSLLPKVLTPVLGAGLLSAATWGYAGASGLSPSLFRRPLAWLALFGVLSAAAIVFERGRARRQGLRAHTRGVLDSAAAARRREAAQRTNLGRYRNH